MLTKIVKKQMEIVDKNEYCWNINCLLKRYDRLVKIKWRLLNKVNIVEILCVCWKDMTGKWKKVHHSSKGREIRCGTCSTRIYCRFIRQSVATKDNGRHIYLVYVYMGLKMPIKHSIMILLMPLWNFTWWYRVGQGRALHDGIG